LFGYTDFKRYVPLKLKGKLYAASVQSVLRYESETWALEVGDVQLLECTDRMMVR
jgi:hypothetical protein